MEIINDTDTIIAYREYFPVLQTGKNKIFFIIKGTRLSKC